MRDVKTLDAKTPVPCLYDMLLLLGRERIKLVAEQGIDVNHLRGRDGMEVFVGVCFYEMNVLIDIFLQLFDPRVFPVQRAAVAGKDLLRADGRGLR